MKARFSETHRILSCINPAVGNFGLEFKNGKEVRWDYCREQFACKFTEKTEGFFFSHPHGKIYDVGEFLTKFEFIVGINQTTIFCESGKTNITWIEPANFWKNCFMKRSLLTLLLRCGMNYDVSKDNFDDALFGSYKECDYIKETKLAVIRFMFGFTQFTGRVFFDTTGTLIKHGWREEFSKLDNLMVKKKLVMPQELKEEQTLVGINSLWM